jgi:hypothetical protein
MTRQVNLPQSVASSIIVESLHKHVLADETERTVTCRCGEVLRLVWSSAATIRTHQAEVAAAELADFTARVEVSA